MTKENPSQETAQRPPPRYYGMRFHVDKEAGYGFWHATTWTRFDLPAGRQGVIYTPYPDRYDTCFSVEKRTLDYAVKESDAPVLRKGFRQGLAVLDGVEIASQDETITKTLLIFEAKYAFNEGEARRMRWTRVVYWGEAQLILIAQGADEDEYHHWMPMFYNTMMTFQVL